MDNENGSIKNLADVRDAIMADGTLPSGRKKAVRTHFKSYAKAHGKLLNALPADPRIHRPFLKAFHAAKAGYSQAHWGNIVSSLNFALHHLGLTTLRGRSASPMTPKWQTLYRRSIETGITQPLENQVCVHVVTTRHL